MNDFWDAFAWTESRTFYTMTHRLLTIIGLNVVKYFVLNKICIFPLSSVFNRKEERPKIKQSNNSSGKAIRVLFHCNPFQI